jgi:type IX secretion system PorP/SprF family membrane protein
MGISIRTCALWMLLCGGTLSAQDMAFTQFYASPLLLNPAMTGLFDGKYRVSALYRNQWGAPFRRDAFKSFSAGLDVRFPIKRRRDFFAGGLVFYSDRVGTGNFNTTQIALSASFHKTLDADGRHFLGGGFQAGILQRNVTYEGLSFDDQFNGIDGYSLGTNEVLPTNSLARGDMAAGLYWQVATENNNAFYLGAAVHHLNRPDVSFVDAEGAPTNRLFLKTSVQLGASLPFGEKNNRHVFLPRIVALWQGPHLALNAGTNVRIGLTEYENVALHLGTWARPVRDVSKGFGLDAVVFFAGFEYKGLNMGLSYDANVADFSAPGPFRSALEFSLTFIGNYDDDMVACPTF